MFVRQQCNLLGSPGHMRACRSKHGIWRTNAVVSSSTDQTRVLQLTCVGVWRRTSQEGVGSWRLGRRHGPAAQITMAAVHRCPNCRNRCPDSPCKR